jgi:hypothetical protein
MTPMALYIMMDGRTIFSVRAPGNPKGNRAKMFRKLNKRVAGN